jgi:hypothetical protein
MSIIPTDPGSVDRPSIGRLRRLPVRAMGEPKRHTDQPKGPDKTDQVEISQGARRLLEANELPSGGSAELTPEQLREVLDRIAEGFYDRPEVRDRVIRRLLPLIRDDRSV